MDFLNRLHSRLESSKWLPWLGMLPLVVMLGVAFATEDTFKALGFVTVTASIFGGAWLGSYAGALIGRLVFKNHPQIRERQRVAFTVFGFLFFPVVVGKLTNTYLNTGIEFYSTGKHLAIAGFMSFFAFLISSPKSKTKNSGNC